MSPTGFITSNLVLAHCSILACTAATSLSKFIAVNVETIARGSKDNGNDLMSWKTFSLSKKLSSYEESSSIIPVKVERCCSRVVFELLNLIRFCRFCSLLVAWVLDVVNCQLSPSQRSFADVASSSTIVRVLENKVFPRHRTTIDLAFMDFVSQRSTYSCLDPLEGGFGDKATSLESSRLM